MAKQTQAVKQTQEWASEQAPAETAPVDTEASNKLKADIDSLLDEIDEVLEVNAEEFVGAFVQRGGE